MTSKGAEDGSLDLGLSAILGEADKPLPFPEQPRIQAEPPIEAVPLTEYEEFAESSDWTGLAQYCEGRLAVDGDSNLDARLWWILAQKQLRTLPDVLLAAPLDAALLAASAPGTDPNSARLSERVKRQIDELSAPVDSSQVGATPVGRPRISNPMPTSSPAVLTAGMTQTISRYKSAILLSAGGLLVTLGVLWQTRIIFSSPSIPAPVRVELAAEPPSQLATLLQPKDGMGNLGAIFYDMSAPAATIAPAKVVEAAPTVIAAPVSVALQQPEAQSKPKSKKERLDMSGPVEPPALRNRLSNGFGRSDGTAFEPPVRSTSKESATNNPPPRFDDGGVFEMVVRTNVLSEPSIYGRVIARLDAGDRIRVDAHLGRWVRIVGSKGRPGFVLSQDVGARVR